MEATTAISQPHRGQTTGSSSYTLAAEIAWTMFGRWSQENWFKYMRSEYALDAPVDCNVELDDQEHLVGNPRWRELNRQVASARGPGWIPPSGGYFLG